MKRKLALFLALCTLSGCANTTPEKTTTPEISETTSVTTEITTPPPVTTTTKTTTAVTEKAPPEYEGDMPELTAKNIPYTIEKRVRIDDLLGQIDIKPQIDITKLDDYESSVWFYENLATEEEKAYMTDNNYMRHFASLDYIGTELADWLLQIDYYFITDGETPPEYMRLFYVKDGKVTEELQNIDFIIYGNADNSIHTDDFIYMSTWNKGIYEFNKHTGELKNIVALDSWSSVSTIDDKYIFFRAEECLQIYDRENVKVTKTDIYQGMYDGTAVKYNGEVLYYSEDNKYYCYDIATGETSELSEFGVAAANLDYPWDMIAGNSIGKYHICTKQRGGKTVSMTVTVRESGTQRNYIFEEIAQNFLNDGCVHVSLHGEVHGMLCFTIDTYTGSYLFLLDPERNTIQYFNADETDTFFLSAIADTLICYTDSGYYTVMPEIKYEKADLFPDEELYPVPSDEVTEVLYAEEIRIEKYSEQDFPDKEHLRLAQETYWADNTAQEWIEKYNASSRREDLEFEKVESVENLRIRDGYYYDFDKDGENESIIAISHSIDYIQTAYCYYVDDGKAQNLGKCECLGIAIYDFGNSLKVNLNFLFGATFICGNIYDFSNGEAKLVSGDSEPGGVLYENGFFAHYQKYEQFYYPVICCPDGVLRQAGREEITREDFEKHVKNGAEYLNELEAQYISINKIETWGHYTYQLSCTERGADFGINIIMGDNGVAHVRTPYIVANEPQLTEEYIHGVDVWALTSAKRDSLSDEKGLLTNNYAAQIDKLMSTTAYGHPFAALQDFNGDDFPEIVVIEHNSGQGLMPCKIYDAETLEYMGEFMGFCRDGFTNFYETADGVVVYNYYEHSVHSRYEGYSLMENVDGVFTERIVSSETGIFNACGAENAGITWENSAGYKGIRYEAEGYCVSTFGYDIHATEAGKFLVDFYNNCKQIESTYIRELCGIESFSVFEAPLLAMGDYDMDGKPEAFFQLGINKPLSFIDSELNISEVELSDPSFDSYYASSVYKLWNGIIVFQGMGNSEPCLIYTVKNGKPTEITELSGKGMMFDYSRMYNGCYELYDSEYDGPYHTWKPYIYYHGTNGWCEYGSTEISREDFLILFGDEAQEIFDRIAAMETPVENSGNWEVRNILYRADKTYIINYGWYICNEHIVVKPGVAENDRLIEYPDYGGVYAAAFIPEIAVYPDSTY